MEITIKKNPIDHDSDDLLIDGKFVGYVSKEGKNAGLVRCPKCGKENYMMLVLEGICAWCGFDLKKLIKKFESI